MGGMTNEDLWDAALGQVELSISKANFSTWFKNTAILSVDEKHHVTIGVPNGFAKEWLEKKYCTYILSALRTFRPEIAGMSCTIYTPRVAPRPVDALGGQEKKPAQAPAAQAQTPSSQSQEKNLNPRYTFDTFIVGENNELAKAACHAVCSNLGKIYNPLFIYGGVGLGKTHLLQAIGNQVSNAQPEKRVVYTTTERFTSELIGAIKGGTIDQFKAAYQKVDLLIIDDVQFLSGKEKTQEEFFHIFNSLYQRNRQIVISSDRSPKAIATLEDRLRSRFEGGMIVDIGQPNLETRVAILRAKAENCGLSLTDDMVQYIAENIKNNVRELEGALNRVAAVCELKQTELTLELLRDALSELVAGGKKRGVQTKDIVQTIARFYEVDSKELISRGRKKEVVRPRQIAMYLLRTELNISYPGIGAYFGGRDHTTALHAYEKISGSVTDDDRLREEIEVLKEKIYSVD